MNHKLASGVPLPVPVPVPVPKPVRARQGLIMAGKSPAAQRPLSPVLGVCCCLYELKLERPSRTVDPSKFEPVDGLFGDIS